MKTHSSLHEIASNLFRRFEAPLFLYFIIDIFENFVRLLKNI